MLLQLQYGIDPEKYSSTKSASLYRRVPWFNATMDVRPSELLRDAATVGYGGFRNVASAFAHLSAAEVRSLRALVAARAAIVRSHYLLSPSPAPMKLHPMWHTVEPTEQVFASFLAGLALCQLTARFLLHLKFLFHFRLYTDPSICITAPALTVKSQRVPDFLGDDGPGSWHLIEAKGTSKSFTSSQAERAIDQTKAISTINGVNPLTRCAGVAFTNRQDAIKVRFIDPPDSPKGAEELKFDASRLVAAHYRLLFRLITCGDEQDTRELAATKFKTFRFPESDISMGMPVDIFDRIGKLELKDDAGIKAFANYVRKLDIPDTDLRSEFEWKPHIKDDSVAPRRRFTGKRPPISPSLGDRVSIRSDGLLAELGSEWGAKDFS